MRGLLGLTVIVCLFTMNFGSPEQAVAGHASKDCGILSKGSRDYRVRALAMPCERARRGSSRYLRTQAPRPGFDCAPTEGGNFYCQNGAKAYWATRL